MTLLYFLFDDNKLKRESLLNDHLHEHQMKIVFVLQCGMVPEFEVLEVLPELLSNKLSENGRFATGSQLSDLYIPPWND